MQSSPSTDVQGGDNELSQVVTDCLQTPVILRIILEHLSTTELLALSLVNKQWNREARSVLRDRGSLTATIKSRHSCERLICFADDVRQMNVVPFSGIHIELNAWCIGGDGDVLSLDEELDPFFHVIIERLRWKYLSVRFPRNNDSWKYCPAFQLAKKILDSLDGVLEELSLTVFASPGQFIQNITQGCKFARLKTLTLKDTYRHHDKDYTDLIKALVSRAPNLQELITQSPLDFVENPIKGSSALLLTDHEFSPALHEVSESIMHIFRMRRMEFREISKDLSLQRIKMITPLLLQTSRTTLSSMFINAVFLAPLMCYGICLENVRELKLNVNHLEKFRPCIRRLVKEFDFTRIFPRVTTIKCFVSPKPNPRFQNQIIEMISMWNPALIQPMPDRAVNIKNLRLNFFPLLRDRSAEFLPELLPHIETLSVKENIPNFIWEQPWKDLKNLEVVTFQNKFSVAPNLDSVFCGIYPEEVAQLREMDDDYLQAVNIVPVMPSILCLKGLRTFTIKVCQAYCSRHEPTNDLLNEHAYVLSKVTRLVAFKQCPALSVIVKTEREEVLKAMMGYGK